MDMNKVLFCGIIALIWTINEIMCIRVYENVSEIKEAPFTIDTNPNSKQMQASTTTSEPIKLFLPAQSQTDNFNPNQATTESFVKAQILVAENQKIKSYNSMIVKNNKEMLKQMYENTTQVPDRNERKRQQVLQIPPLLSPLATSDPKATNSSKRQTDDILDSDGDKRFIPSQELGSFDSSEGFVPHVFHEPKAISYLPPTYLPPKPIKHDANYGFTLGESRLPASAQKDMQAFEHDFEDLKAKYPELNDLVNNYPIMEEIMKQKLSEKFQMSHYDREKSPTPPFSDNDNQYKGKFPNGNQQSHEYYGGFKFPSNSNENTDYKDQKQGGYSKGKNHPFPFEVALRMKRPNSGEKTTSSGSSSLIPAGEFYQDKFPLSSFLNYDGKNSNHSGPKQVDSHNHKSASPWKRILHLITAFLPVGILISALTPNVINIANVPNKKYPIRQRSLGDKQDFSIAESGALIDMLDERIRKGSETYKEDPECDERNFCDMSIRGKEPKASPAEKIFWRLAHSTPENVADIVGMKNLFRAIRFDKCADFKCKVREDTTDNDGSKERIKKSIQIENDSYDLHSRDEIQERFSRVLYRQKRARNKLYTDK